MRPTETPAGTFESRRPWIKADLNWGSPFSRHGEPQPQLANVEYLLAADGFIMHCYLKSSITTLAIEAPFRFADQQRLSDVVCFIECKPRCEREARHRLHILSHRCHRLRILQTEPNVGLFMACTLSGCRRLRIDLPPLAEIHGLDHGFVGNAALSRETRLAQNEEDEICPQAESPLLVLVVGRMVNAMRQNVIKVGSGRNNSDQPILVGPLNALALIGCAKLNLRVLDWNAATGDCEGLRPLAVARPVAHNPPDAPA